MDYTVGQVAALSGVTVRTLHHYDERGLVRPCGRTAAGYRTYDDRDLARLRDVLAYRDLGFSLEEVARILDDPQADAQAHLRRQHGLVRQRIARLHQVLGHLEKAMEAQQMGISLTPEEQFEIFGPEFAERADDLAEEAEQRWGDTQAWGQSQRRTAAYTAQDWIALKAEGDAIEQGFAAALRAGVAAKDRQAMDLAAQHRAHIARWFYDVPVAMHRGLADLYVADPRFAEHYDRIEPGLAAFVHDAVHANADRVDAAGAAGE